MRSASILADGFVHECFILAERLAPLLIGRAGNDFSVDVNARNDSFGVSSGVLAVSLFVEIRFQDTKVRRSRRKFSVGPIARRQLLCGEAN